jgi:hypothetical protein
VVRSTNKLENYVTAANTLNEKLKGLKRRQNFKVYGSVGRARLSNNPRNTRLAINSRANLKDQREKFLAQAKLNERFKNRLTQLFGNNAQLSNVNRAELYMKMYPKELTNIKTVNQLAAFRNAIPSFLTNNHRSAVNTAIHQKIQSLLKNRDITPNPENFEKLLKITGNNTQKSAILGHLVNYYMNQGGNNSIRMLRTLARRNNINQTKKEEITNFLKKLNTNRPPPVTANIPRPVNFGRPTSGSAPSPISISITQTQNARAKVENARKNLTSNPGNANAARKLAEAEQKLKNLQNQLSRQQVNAAAQLKNAQNAARATASLVANTQKNQNATQAERNAALKAQRNAEEALKTLTQQRNNAQSLASASNVLLAGQANEAARELARVKANKNATQAERNAALKSKNNAEKALQKAREDAQTQIENLQRQANKAKKNAEAAVSRANSANATVAERNTALNAARQAQASAEALARATQNNLTATNAEKRSALNAAQKAKNEAAGLAAKLIASSALAKATIENLQSQATKAKKNAEAAVSRANSANATMAEQGIALKAAQTSAKLANEVAISRQKNINSLLANSLSTENQKRQAIQAAENAKKALEDAKKQLEHVRAASLKQKYNFKNGRNLESRIKPISENVWREFVAASQRGKSAVNAAEQILKSRGQTNNRKIKGHIMNQFNWNSLLPVAQNGTTNKKVIKAVIKMLAINPPYIGVNGINRQRLKSNNENINKNNEQFKIAISKIQPQRLVKKNSGILGPLKVLAGGVLTVGTVLHQNPQARNFVKGQIKMIAAAARIPVTPQQINQAFSLFERKVNRANSKLNNRTAEQALQSSLAEATGKIPNTPISSNSNQNRLRQIASRTLGIMPNSNKERHLLRFNAALNTMIRNAIGKGKSLNNANVKSQLESFARGSNWTKASQENEPKFSRMVGASVGALAAGAAAIPLATALTPGGVVGASVGGRGNGRRQAQRIFNRTGAYPPHAAGRANARMASRLLRPNLNSAKQMFIRKQLQKAASDSLNTRNSAFNRAVQFAQNIGMNSSTLAVALQKPSEAKRLLEFLSSTV